MYKWKVIWLMVLVASAALCACGDALITAEPINPAEQTIETDSTRFLVLPSTIAPTTISTVVVESTIGNSSSTVATTATVRPTGALSQAWIESQALLPEQGPIDFADINIYIDYLSVNPNDASTPMGALCWSFHELIRSQHMDYMRYTLDHYMVPFLMENYGITDEQIGPPGPEATGKLFDLVLSDIGPVSSADDSPGQMASPGETGPVGSVGSIDDTEDALTEANIIGYYKDMHEFAGDGTAWSVAVRTIASPEMTAAFEAGEGLPATVQVYADALIAFAKEHVGKPLDHSAESDALSFALAGFPGIGAFVEEAKYNQDCKRALIA